MTIVERRKIERFPLRLDASLSVEGEKGHSGKIRLTTENISAAGAYLVSSAQLPIGTDVGIEFILPIGKFMKVSGKSSHVKVTGAIIRTGENGMAILFNKRYKIMPY